MNQKRVDTTERALRGLFDHAGMFPPASKPFAEALQDAATFATRLHRPGIVGADVVLAWKDWPALNSKALAAAGFSGPCRVAIVGVSQDSAPAVAREIAKHNANNQATPVVSLEIHAEGDFHEQNLRDARAAAPGFALFVEPRWPSERVAKHVGHVGLLAQALGFGLKVRCGGPTALDTPALAAAIRAAADLGLPFKATQGLHHPVPGQGFIHGFLGVLTAFRLRQALGHQFDDLEACLLETNVKSFHLDDGIAWNGHHVGPQRLGQLAPFAIGSCSLAEPDDDLLHVLGPPSGA